MINIYTNLTANDNNNDNNNNNSYARTQHATLALFTIFIQLTPSHI